MTIEQQPLSFPESSPNSSLEAVLAAFQDPKAELRCTNPYPGIIQVEVVKDTVVLAATLLTKDPDMLDALDEAAVTAEQTLRNRSDSKELNTMMYGISRYVVDQIIYKKRYNQDMAALREAGILPQALVSMLNDVVLKVFSNHR